MPLFQSIKSLIIIAAFVVLGFMQASGQRIVTGNDYSREFSFGAMAHPKGLGFNFRFGRVLSPTRVDFLETEFLGLRHPKEIRIWNTAQTNTNPYTYGKLNYAYALRVGYGNKFQLIEKKLKNTVSISLNVTAGPVLAVLKPVYLNLVVTDINNVPIGVITRKVTEESVIDQSEVLGNAPFSKGLNELNMKVGGYAKAGFNFDWGDFTDEIHAIEVGVFVDAFPERLPLMMKAKNKYLFPSFYICAVFGNKW